MTEASPENLRKFLESDDPAIRRMGLSMAKGSGIRDKAIIGLYFWEPEEENQKAADELIKEIGIENFKEFPEWLEPFNHSNLEATLGSWMYINHLTKSVELITSFPDERSTDLLIGVLKADHKGYNRINGIVIEELGKRETTKAVPSIIDILETYAPGVLVDLLTSCINALRRINDKRGIEPIKSLIAHASQTIRKNAAESLETLGWKPENEDEKLDYLVAKQDWKSLILNGKDAVEKLVPRLEDKSETICCEVAKTLGKIDDESVVDPLIKALGMDMAGTSSSTSYKYSNALNLAALNALTEIGDTAFKAKLFPDIKKKTSIDIVPGLIKNIRNRKKKISETCIDILGNIGDSRAIIPLIELLELKKKWKKGAEAFMILSKKIEVPLKIKEDFAKKVIIMFDSEGWSLTRTYIPIFREMEMEATGSIVNILDKSLARDISMEKWNAIFSILKKIGGQNVVSLLIKHLDINEIFTDLKFNLRYDSYDNAIPNVPLCSDKIFVLVKGGKKSLYEAKYNGKKPKSWRGGEKKYYLSHPSGTPKRDLAIYDYKSPTKSTAALSPEIVDSVIKGKDLIFSLSEERLLKIMKKEDRIVFLEDVDQIYNDTGLNIEFKSSSKPGKSYNVQVERDKLSGKIKGIWCNCPGFNYRKTCKHADEAKQMKSPKKVEYEYRINTYTSANEPEKMPWNIEWPKISEEEKDLIHAPVENTSHLGKVQVENLAPLDGENELLSLIDNHGKDENEELWATAAANLDLDGVSKVKIKAKAILELGKLNSDKSVKVILEILEKIRIVMLSWEKRRENIPVGKGSVAKKKIIEQQQQSLLDNLEKEYIGNNEATIRIIAKVLGEIGNKDAIEPLTNLYLETIATPGEWIWDENNEYIGSAEKSLCTGFTQKYIRSALEKLDSSKLEFIDKKMKDKYEKLGYKFSCKDQCVTEDLPEKRWSFGQYTVEAIPENETTGPNTYYLQCNCSEYNSGFEEVKGYCTHTDEVKGIINLICNCPGRLSGFQTANFPNIEYSDLTKTWHKFHSARASLQNIYYLFGSYRTGYNMHESPSIAGYFEHSGSEDDYLLRNID